MNKERRAAQAAIENFSKERPTGVFTLCYEREASTAWPLSGVGLLLRDA